MLSDIFQIPENFSYRFPISDRLIREVIFFRQGGHSISNEVIIILRHLREEMMLDLEVKITHPPIRQRGGGDVHRVL